MIRSTTGLLALVCAVGIGLWAGVASSQSADDAERGRRLFDEGQKAMEARDFAAACPKFEESYKVSGVVGSLLNWADCEESRNRLGTALELWQQGEAKVVREADRLDFVRKRIAALDPRVPRLTVFVVDARAQDVQATLDGKVIDVSRAALPIDPGKHALHVTAKGGATDDRSFEIAAAEAKKIDVLPDAGPIASATASASATAAASASPRVSASAAPSVAAPVSGPSTLAIAGWALGAVGVASMVGFGVTGGLVISKCGGALNPCKGDKGEVGGLNAANAVTLGLGIGGIVTGVALLIVDAKREPAKATGSAAFHRRVVLEASHHGAFVGVDVGF